MHAGDGFVSLGTSGVLSVVGDRFMPNPASAVHAFCHAIPDRWQLMSVVLSAASCLRWVCKLTGTDEPTLLAEVEALDAGALATAPLFLPYLSGERTPHNDPYAQGVFFGMKHQIRQMLAQREGVILNVASMAGLGGAPKLAAYAASKHAVIGLTKTAAIEYARHGIRVNAICPFYSTTPMVTDSDIGDRQDFLAQGSPMKRLGRPEEIVATMLSLCAKENTYLTGQAVAVDGGVSAF
ncbi:hypothetical protein CA830_03555 [Burkholderia multivorans]|nr:hypothetical protein CA830_03555 [Burkholderia multivorans]